MEIKIFLFLFLNLLTKYFTEPKNELRNLEKLQMTKFGTAYFLEMCYEYLYSIFSA